MTLSSLVAGFAITPDNIPDYWIFTYWMVPIHYSLEGIIVTQFHGANQEIEDLPPPENPPTVGRYMASHWNDSFRQRPISLFFFAFISLFAISVGLKYLLGHFGGMFTYSHRFQNLFILSVICGIFRLATLYALTFIDYTTR